jgi:hypothetical protein
MDTSSRTPCQQCAGDEQTSEDARCSECAYGAQIGRTQFETGCDPTDCSGCIQYDECHTDTKGDNMTDHRGPSEAQCAYEQETRADVPDGESANAYLLPAHLADLLGDITKDAERYREASARYTKYGRQATANNVERSAARWGAFADSYHETAMLLDTYSDAIAHLLAKARG